MRSGRRSRTRSRTPAARQRDSARRSTASRSTSSGCGRTSRAETLSEAERFSSAARDPEDYLGSANAFVDRALDFYRGT